MRFLVDENLPAEVAEWLRDDGHDVLDVAASPRRGQSDAELWKCAAEETRIIVTRDLDYPLRGQDSLPPGLILVRSAPRMQVSDLMALIQNGLTTAGLDNLTGRVTVIEPGRVRQRPYSKLPR